MASKGMRINKTISKEKSKIGGFALWFLDLLDLLRQYDSVVMIETQINKIESTNKTT